MLARVIDPNGQGGNGSAISQWSCGRHASEAQASSENIAQNYIAP